MKYYYRWFIQTNNLGYGCIIVSNEYKTRSDAVTEFTYYQQKYGCCEIIKKRVYIQK